MDDFGSEWWKDYAYEIYAHTDPRSSFRSLWNSINAKKPDRQWDKNPYVWVIEFKVLEIRQ